VSENSALTSVANERRDQPRSIDFPLIGSTVYLFLGGVNIVNEWLYKLFLINSRLPPLFKVFALVSLLGIPASWLGLRSSGGDAGLDVAITIIRAVPVLVLAGVCLILARYAYKNADMLGNGRAPHGLLRLDLDTERFRVHRLNSEDAVADAPALKPFVTFSDQEMAISLSNPSLRGNERLRLYQHWLRRSPNSFMILESLPDGNPVAVSIILPLTEEGWAKVRRKEIDIIKLQDWEIGDCKTETIILIDTLIVGKGAAWRLFHRRKDHEGNLWPFLIDHLALFWQDGQPVTLIVEPDQKGVLNLCRDFGFDVVTYKTKTGSKLCVLRYEGQRLRPLSARILAKVKERAAFSRQENA